MWEMDLACRRMMLMTFAVVVIGALGCAPQWMKGVSHNPYYYQGVGCGNNEKRADFAAYVDLAAEKKGITIADTVRMRTSAETLERDGVLRSRLEEQFNESLSTVVEGLLEEGPKIISRSHNPSQNLHWSYAVLQRPNTTSEIQAHARGMRTRAFVPGLAQFSKGHSFRGLSILTAWSGSVLGALVCNNMREDALNDRDNSTTSRDWDFYQDKANEYRDWTLGLGAVAAVVYVINVYDGLSSKPSPGPRYYGPVSEGKFSFDIDRRAVYLRYVAQF